MKKIFLILLFTTSIFAQSSKMLLLMGGGTSLYDSLNNDNYLVAHYSFDDNITDISKYSNDMTWTGTPEYTAGWLGFAMAYDSTIQYASALSNASLDFGTGDFTIAFWLKLPSARTPAAGNSPQIFARGMTTSAPAKTWGFVYAAGYTDYIYFYIASDAGGAYDVNLLFTQTMLNDSTWHHLAVVRKDSVVMAYFDGGYESQYDSSCKVEITNTKALSVGNNVYSNGTIDEARIYKRALTDREIRAIYDYENSDKAIDESMISFVYDDGGETDYTVMKPVFDAHNMVGCASVITSNIGTGVKLTKAELETMQTDGWEIMSHTKTHYVLDTCTSAIITSELKDSRDSLWSWGIDTRNIAYPTGANNYLVREIASQYYRSGASVGGNINSTIGTTNYGKLRTFRYYRQSIDDATKCADYEALIDLLEVHKGWLILYAHTTDADDATMVDTLMDYITLKNIPVVTVNEALDIIGVPADTAYYGTNLITDSPNINFDVEKITNGGAEANITGWTGYNTTRTYDNTTAANGTVGSCKGVSTASDVYNYLYSPVFSIVKGKTYEGSIWAKVSDVSSPNLLLPPLQVSLANALRAQTLSMIENLNKQDSLTTSFTQFKFRFTADTTLANFTIMVRTKKTVAGQWTLWADEASIILLPDYVSNGNHSISYSGTTSTITATDAGDATTNYISLPTAKYTAITAGQLYRFKLDASTVTAGVTITFNLGDKSLTKTVPASGDIYFDFKATTSTVGDIKLYFNKTADVDIDNISLRSGN